MNEWYVRLEGGPYDGDSSSVRWDGPVPTLWVTFCHNCQDSHWFGIWHDGGEVYHLDECHDERREAKYVHALLTGSSLSRAIAELANA